MFARVIILFAALAVACASLIGPAGVGSPAIAIGAYGSGGRGSIVPVASAPVGYALNGAVGGRGIGGYGSGAPVVAAPVGYDGRGAIGSRGIGEYGIGVTAAAAPVGYSGQRTIGGRGSGGYGSGSIKTIGASSGIVRGGGASSIGIIY